MNPFLGFNKIPDIIRHCSDFEHAKRESRNEYLSIILSLNDNLQMNYPKELLNWSVNKLHSREIHDRVAALTGISYYVNFIETQTDLQNLVAQLERILPTDNVTILDGISDIFGYVNNKMETPFLPKLFQRCLNWIKTNPTQHAIISTTILMKKLYFSHCFDFEQAYFFDILFRVGFDNKEVQTIIIDLTIKMLEREPSANEKTKSLINECINSLQNSNSVSRYRVIGSLILLERLSKKFKRVTESKLDDFFPHILRSLRCFVDSEILDSLFLVLSIYRDNKKYDNEILEILKREDLYSTEENCKSLVKFMSLYSESLIDFMYCLTLKKYNEYSQYIDSHQILSKETDNVDNTESKSSDLQVDNADVVGSPKFGEKPDNHTKFAQFFNFTKVEKEPTSLPPEAFVSNGFFVLVKTILATKPSVVDHSLLYKALLYSRLTKSKVSIVGMFLKEFGFYSFSLVKAISYSISNYIQDQEHVYEAVYAIRKLTNHQLFDSAFYYPKCRDIFFSNISEELKLEVLKTLMSIIKYMETDMKKTTLVELIFLTANDDSKNIKMNLLKLLDDNFCDIYSDESLSAFLEQFLDDKSSGVRLETIELCGRIKKSFPLNVLNLFWVRISRFETTFFNTGSLSERKKLMKTLPRLIKHAGKFAHSLIRKITLFIIRVLNTDPPVHDTHVAKINQHLNDRNDLMIRSYVFESIIEYGKQYIFEEIIDIVVDLIDAIIHQLGRYSQHDYQILIAKTLTEIFRSVDIINKTSYTITEFHQKIYKFMGSQAHYEVMQEFMSLLGVIGPLDPAIFHDTEAQQNGFDSSALCFPSKREKCYLDFVMNYIVAQLSSSSRTHDPGTLVHAIVYIFQSDTRNCLPYLGSVVKIFVKLFAEPVIKERVESLLSFLRSIILLVDTEIDVYADDVIELIQPFLYDVPSLGAVKVLSALVYCLKTNFQRFTPKTFKTVINALIDKRITVSETRLYLLLTLNLLAIYADICPQEYFVCISAVAQDNTGISSHAIVFLAQALFGSNMHQIILPSLKLALKSVTRSDLKSSALQLLYVLVAKYSDIVLKMPLNLEDIDPTLDQLIKMAKQESDVDLTKFKFVTKLTPVPDPLQVRQKQNFEVSPVSGIFAHGKLHTSAAENNWNIWALQFTTSLCLCSSSPAIRACLPLLSASTEFHFSIFPLALLSVWEKVCENDHRTVENYIREVIAMPNVPVSVLQLFAFTFEVLDKANFSLFENDTLTPGVVAERSNLWFIALRLFERGDLNDQTVSHVLTILTQIKRKDTALGLRSLFPDARSDCKLMESLSLWSEARTLYEEKLKNCERNDEYLAGLLRCSMKTDNWSSIQSRFDDFSSYPRPLQIELGHVFGAAAISLNLDETRFFESVVEDTSDSCYWRAIASINRKDFNDAKIWIERGLRTLCRDSSVFASGNYEPTIPTVCFAMIFQELSDVVSVYEKKAQISRVLSLWKNKLKHVPSLASRMKMIFRARSILPCPDNDKLEMNLYFFNSLRRMHEWNHFDSLVNLLEPKNDPRVRLLLAKVAFDRGQVNDLSEFISLIEDLGRRNQQKILCNAICSYAARTPDRQKAINMLKEVILLQPNNVRAYRYYAYSNIFLAVSETQDSALYANAALSAFCRLNELTGPSMHYLCQIISIFFNYGTQLKDFQKASETILKLEPDSIHKVIPQLMIQFNHPDAQLRNHVYTLIEKLSKTNFQSIAFPLFFLKSQKGNSDELITFIKGIENMHMQEAMDVGEFASSLRDLSTLPEEKIVLLLDRIIRLDQKRIMDGYSTMDATGDNHFISKLSKYIHKIVSIVDGGLPGFDPEFKLSDKDYYNYIVNYARGETNLDMDSLVSSIKTFFRELNKIIDQKDVVDILEMGKPLSNKKSYNINVPGQNNDAKVQSVYSIMKIVPSVDRPKKMQIVGSDGHTYKYLLKGGADLRLDQYVMQLFSLINSIFKSDKLGESLRLKVCQYGITPLSADSGLISWVDNSKTLYSLIQWYRKLMNIGNVERDMLINKIPELDFPSLTKIQRFEIFQELCNCSSPSDIKEALWLRSYNAESWLTHVTSFSRSAANMSVIGYVIGLGDRHPSNILLNQKYGSVVHIDLSNIFDKTRKRSSFAEMVPFRLTRMIVSALGPSGYIDTFRETSIYVLTILARNRAIILSFLDMFVKQSSVPIIDKKRAHDFGQDFLKHAIDDVSNKLLFTNINGKRNHSSAEHVDELIKEATDLYNLSQMYYGWSPFW